VAALPPPQWAPLSEAFLQIRGKFGSSELAARDLRQGLLDGGLPSAARWISEDGKETCLLLKPTFWKTTAQVRWWDDIAWEDGRQQRAGVAVSGRGKELSGSWHFFVHRAELDKLYPVAAVPAPTRREEPREWRLIRRLAAEEWPDGYEDIRTARIIARVSDRLTEMGEPIPHRSTFERALGRREG
jgi:hypothetical protein